MRGRRTLVRLRAPLTEDDYGNESRDWQAATEALIHRCELQPEQGLEDAEGRQTTVIRWRLFAPAGTDLEATDRVRDGEDVYAVDGPPQRWGRGSRGYVTALLERSAG